MCCLCCVAFIRVCVCIVRCVLRRRNAANVCGAVRCTSSAHGSAHERVPHCAAPLLCSRQVHAAKTLSHTLPAHTPHTQDNRPLSKDHYHGLYIAGESVARGKNRVNVSKFDSAVDKSGVRMWCAARCVFMHCVHPVSCGLTAYNAHYTMHMHTFLRTHAQAAGCLSTRMITQSTPTPSSTQNRGARLHART